MLKKYKNTKTHTYKHINANTYRRHKVWLKYVPPFKTTEHEHKFNNNHGFVSVTMACWG